MLSTTPSYSRSAELHAAACDVLPGGANSNFRLGGQPVPLFFERAEGARLYDVDGNVYLDYALGMGPNILGHAPATVLSAVAASLGRGQLFAGQYAEEAQLGRLVRSLVPCAEMVRFGCSGSEMDQAAIRVARAFTGRPKIVKFEGHYHGWLDTLLVSTAPPLDQAGPPEAPTPYLQSAGQSRSAAADVAVLPWNDLAAVAGYLRVHANETAGVLMEPILCNTSVVLPRAGYLEGVRELCDRHGVVLIFDEVITGFRVGPGGAQQRLGVTPDLAVFGKAMGAGFPISALAGKRQLMELCGGPVLHGGSYNTHMASTSAAMAGLTELARDGGRLYREMEQRGNALMHGLRQVAERAGEQLLVQGLGMVFNTAFTSLPEVTDYRSYQRTDLARQKRFLRALQDHGVRPTSRGTWFLSTAHTVADVDETVRATEAALLALRNS
ncbi:MAG: aspartate aminotransferase family protein [Chloroflexota bacterium]|nr:aspartate aminotransferase family protein [Chloroflexota bacterium]